MVNKEEAPKGQPCQNNENDTDQNVRELEEITKEAETIKEIEQKAGCLVLFHGDSCQITNCRITPDTVDEIYEIIVNHKVNTLILRSCSFVNEEAKKQLLKDLKELASSHLTIGIIEGENIEGYELDCHPAFSPGYYLTELETLERKFNTMIAQENANEATTIQAEKELSSLLLPDTDIGIIQQIVEIKRTAYLNFLKAALEEQDEEDLAEEVESNNPAPLFTIRGSFSSQSQEDDFELLNITSPALSDSEITSEEDSNSPGIDEKQIENPFVRADTIITVSNQCLSRRLIETYADTVTSAPITEIYFYNCTFAHTGAKPNLSAPDAVDRTTPHEKSARLDRGTLAYYLIKNLSLSLAQNLPEEDKKKFSEHCGISEVAKQIENQLLKNTKTCETHNLTTNPSIKIVATKTAKTTLTASFNFTARSAPKLIYMLEGEVFRGPSESIKQLPASSVKAQPPASIVRSPSLPALSFKLEKSRPAIKRSSSAPCLSINSNNMPTIPQFWWNKLEPSPSTAVTEQKADTNTTTNHSKAL